MNPPNYSLIPFCFQFFFFFEVWFSGKQNERKWSYVWLFVTPWTVCSPPGSSIYGILQARILEWVAIPFSRGSSRPRDWTQVSRIAGRLLTIWATREAVVKNPATMQETQEMWVQPLRQQDPLEEGNATHFSFLTWRIPGTEEPGGCP